MMRGQVSRWVVLCGLGSLAVGVATAQSDLHHCTPGVFVTTSYGIGSEKAKPFTLVAKNTFEQRLADGSHIRGETTTLEARDGAGKTRTEMGLECRFDENRQPQLNYTVNIYDAANRSTTTWNVRPGETTARVAYSRIPTPPISVEPRKPLSAEELEARRKVMAQARASHENFKHEDLGERQIAGVTAQGQRNTITIPAGEQGNEVTLVTVNETWRSKEFGIMMMTINDDPRRGRSTFEVQEFSPGEPDATLFQPPANYKLVEIRPLVETEVKAATETR